MRNDHTGDCPLNSDPAFYTQDMVCTCAVVQVSREKSREISQRGRDAIVNAATPSPDESGLEVPKVVARLMTWRGGNGYPGNHEWSPCARTYNELPKDHYPDGPWAEGEPLMTVAQCSRIVTKLQAELDRKNDLLNRAVEVMGQMRAAMDSSKGALDKLQAYFVANPPTPEQKRRWARELGKPPKE